MNGDGVIDLAVGAFLDDDGGADRGAIYILFMNSNGTVRSQQKISSTQGGFAGALDDFDLFGFALDSLGDLDGDSVVDLVASAPRDDDGGVERGAVYILFLNNNGTVRARQKISSTAGGFSGPLDTLDWFGLSTASVGDLDGDGVSDLAVAAPYDDDGGSNRGAVYILFMNTNGTVKAQQKISTTSGGLTGPIDSEDNFGDSLASLGDLDGDGTTEFAVGAARDDDGGTDRGAVYILFMNTNGTVKAQQKISTTSGGFAGSLDNFGAFGASSDSLGDLDGNGLIDLAVGAYLADDGGANQGAVWILEVENCAPPACPGDADGNSTVGLSDIAALIGFWSSAVPPAPAILDLDGDGSVGLGDIAQVIASWGTSCP